MFNYLADITFKKESTIYYCFCCLEEISPFKLTQL